MNLGACCIYKIVNSVNGKFYIGFTTQPPTKRLSQHVAKAKRGVAGRLYAAMRKHGVDNFTIEIIEQGQDRHHYHDVREPHFIATLKPEYNLTKGGEYAPFSEHTLLKLSQAAKRRWLSPSYREKITKSRTGEKKTAEARVNMSVAQKKKFIEHPELREIISRAHRGRKHSPEHIEKRRIQAIGRKMNPEAVEKAAAARRGKPRSPETKEKIRIAVTGYKHSPIAKEKCRAAALKYWASKSTEDQNAV